MEQEIWKIAHIAGLVVVVVPVIGGGLIHGIGYIKYVWSKK